MRAQLQAQRAKDDHAELLELAEMLARGETPALTADFTWRGAPCAARDLTSKLGALALAPLEVDGVNIVPPKSALEIAVLVERFSGVTLATEDRLCVASVHFRGHVITWGLIVDGAGALRAWFDPSALLQLVAPR